MFYGLYKWNIFPHITVVKLHRLKRCNFRKHFISRFGEPMELQHNKFPDLCLLFYKLLQFGSISAWISANFYSSEASLQEFLQTFAVRKHLCMNFCKLLQFGSIFVWISANFCSSEASLHEFLQTFAVRKQLCMNFF